MGHYDKQYEEDYDEELKRIHKMREVERKRKKKVIKQLISEFDYDDMELAYEIITSFDDYKTFFHILDRVRDK